MMTYAFYCSIFRNSASSVGKIQGKFQKIAKIWTIYLTAAIILLLCVINSQGYKKLSKNEIQIINIRRQSFKTLNCSFCNASPPFRPCPQSSLCGLSREQSRRNRKTNLFILCNIGAINNHTYEKMNTNEIFKYMKTLARMHPRHRSRYSHTAYLHSTIPDPVQNRMIDRYLANV